MGETQEFTDDDITGRDNLSEGLEAVKHFEEVEQTQTDRSKQTQDEILSRNEKRIKDKLADVDRRQDVESQIVDEKTKIGMFTEKEAVFAKEEIRKRFEVDRNLLQMQLDSAIMHADSQAEGDQFTEKLHQGQREKEHHFDEYSRRTEDKQMDEKQMMDFVSGK